MRVVDWLRERKQDGMLNCHHGLPSRSSSLSISRWWCNTKMILGLFMLLLLLLGGRCGQRYAVLKSDCLATLNSGWHTLTCLHNP